MERRREEKRRRREEDRSGEKERRNKERSGGEDATGWDKDENKLSRRVNVFDIKTCINTFNQTLHCFIKQPISRYLFGFRRPGFWVYLLFMVHLIAWCMTANHKDSGSIKETASSAVNSFPIKCKAR